MSKYTATTVAVNGYTVRHLRKILALEVKELAERVGVERPYIAKIELGHSTRVSPKVFNALLKALAIEDRRVLMAQPHDAAMQAWLESLESA